MPVLPTDPTLRGLLLEAIEAQRRLRAAEDEADQQRAMFRTAVVRAHAEGASDRTIAAALEITYARVQQIRAQSAREMSQPPAGGA
jgi:hypothetical protein